VTFDIGVTVPAVYDCDLIEGIERSANAGADTIEFFDWESANTQAIRETAAAHDIAVGGVLAAGAGSNIGDADGEAISYPESYDQAVADIERSIEAANQLEASTLIVTVGQRVDTLSEAAQHNAITRVLREVAPTAEARDVTVVPEPLNTRVDHPGYFLESADRGFEIVEAVGSSHVRLLYDIYHQQITEGNITQTLIDHLDLVGHVHVADVPGRHEPGTGELDYRNIFAALTEASYKGVVSCEFGPTSNPDIAVKEVVELANLAHS